MRITLIIILAALSGWLYYDRANNLQTEIARLNSLLTTSQADLEKSQKTAGLAMAELAKFAPERAALLSRLDLQKWEISQKQAELDRLSQKSQPKSNWLQDEIERRGDPLAPGVGKRTTR